MTIETTQIRMAARPIGEPQDSDFETVTTTLPEPREGQLLVRVLHLSLDPYVRGRMSDAKSYAKPMEVGDVVVGGTVAEVLDSRSPDFSPGDLVMTYAGWQTHALVPAKYSRKIDPEHSPGSTALGVLGMPGFTAYGGLLEIGKPQPGETVVVAAATGPVGSAVGQIARIKGARAVGIAGGPEKCRLLTEHFGFDAAVDHRSPTFAEDLKAAVPQGIDVYFENVGGPVTAEVVRHLNTYARIPVCGLIAYYNATEAPTGPDRLPAFMRRVLTLSLTVRGFIQDEFIPTRHDDFLAEMGQWVRDGQVAFLEDRVTGLAGAPAAFRGLLRGENRGKVVVDVA